jgi:hypothetical protein
MMFGLAEARIRQRQLALRLRSAELRAALQQDAQALHAPLRWADRGLRVWDWLRSTSVLGRLALGSASVLLLRRPGRLMRGLGRGLRWWRLGSTLGPTLIALLAEWLRRPPKR